MALETLESWWPRAGVLKRRGRQDIVSGYNEFTPGLVKPLGYKDEAAGLGVRNVGPRTGALTRYDGDYYLTPGAQVTGLEIFGGVRGKGNASTLVSDCIIHGSTAASTVQSAAIVGSNTSGGLTYDLGGAVFQWCRIDINSNNGFTDGIDGGNYIWRYGEMYGGVDGGGMNTIGNGQIICSRISHGYYDSWWSTAAAGPRTAAYTDAGGAVHNPPFPSQVSGDTHSDAVQIQQYGGWVVRGNNLGGDRPLSGYTSHWDPTVAADYAKILALRNSPAHNNAGVIISSASSANKVGAIIEKNWITGGGARFNLAFKAYDDMSGIHLLNNRFTRSNYGFYVYVQAGAVPELVNNVMDDDGTDAPFKAY